MPNHPRPTRPGRLRRTKRAALACLLTGLACAAPVHNPSVRLAYRLSVDPEAGIRVELSARGLRDRRPEFQLLAGLGMLQDLPAHIVEVAARDGEGNPLAVETVPEGHRTRWRVAPPRGGEVVMSWRVEPFDAAASPEATFLDADHAVVLGYTAFLAPMEITDYLPTEIAVKVAAPAGWPVWTPWPSNGGAWRPETLDRLWSAGVIAGSFRASRLRTGPIDVTVLTEGHWTGVTGMTIANRVGPVLRAMVELFGAPPAGDSLSVLALYRSIPVVDRRSIMIGVSEEGSFFCVATPDRYDNLEELTALAAHECIHFYMGGALNPEPEPPWNNCPDLVWFVEGVTEYLAFRLMRDTGVLTAEGFDRVAARKRDKMLLRQAETPMSLATASRLLSEPRTYELVYTRGFHVAALLDRWMAERCGPGAFDGVLRGLFERHDFGRTYEWLRAADVEEAFERRCPGTRALIRRYALGVEPLPEDPTLARLD